MDRTITGRHIPWERYRHIIIIKVGDPIALAAIRGIAKASQVIGNGNLTVTGCGEQAWQKMGGQVAFRFADYDQNDYRDLFVENLGKVLQPGIWEEVARFDVEPDVAVAAKGDSVILFRHARSVPIAPVRGDLVAAGV